MCSWTALTVAVDSQWAVEAATLQRRVTRFFALEGDSLDSLDFWGDGSKFFRAHFILFFFWLKYLKMLTEWSSNSNTNGSFRGGREGGGVEGVFERFSMDSTAEWIEGSFPSFETLMNSFRDSRDVSNGFSSVWFCHGGDTSASFTSQWIDSEILGPLPRILVPIKTNWNELKWTNEWVREGGGLKEREEKRQETSEEG